MSHPASPASSAPSARAYSKSKFAAFLTAIGAIVLIGAEIWLAAVAALWALDGFFDLAMIGDLILVALIAPAAIWATWMTAKLAIAAEMNPENAD
ncbi:hypothetical protein LL06_12275 [Hoeflea sp. BAL378]|uniref:hypothetical protein n=1 Tax=Hoeflea sp. BAL378 TaxID=1547437 RepID=UPI0005135600|nr:hypothetical protein [Hoeflea sp. BAL378]KGF69249.1 hypothetical protein LL06_12275 [Hoeflea sp. BAL378]